MNTNKFTLMESKPGALYIQSLLDKVKDLLTLEPFKESIESILLIGGYGRNEGGLFFKNGKPALQNNLDIYILLNKENKNSSIETHLKNIISAFSKREGITIDLGFTTTSNFLKNRTLMNYEAAKSHHLIYSAIDLSSILEEKLSQEVPIKEFNNLLVNRGMLLFINDDLFKYSKKYQRKIKTHIAKSIIGLGDYYLYRRNEYSSSYYEKYLTVMKGTSLMEPLASLYIKASKYRFYKREDLFIEYDLNALNEKIKTLFLTAINDDSIYFNKEKVGLKHLLKNTIKKSFIKHSDASFLSAFQDINVQFNNLFHHFLKAKHNNKIVSLDKLFSTWKMYRDPNFIRITKDII